MMICSENLTFDYSTENDKKRAVENVTLNIEKGEFVAVLGRNGSGKSTFAKLVNALLEPTAGSITVNGFDTSNDADLWNVRRSAGMVFQNPDNQIVAAIVDEDVAFGPENLGVPTLEIQRRVAAALAAVGMTEYASRPPHMLSGGQKQRVAIAGALAMKPACLVLDEPTAMLDPVGRREVLETARKLNREDSITILFITHYMDEAVTADRVIVMDGGAVAMDGTPEVVFSRADELKALGLDVPQAAEIALKLRKKGLNLPDGILTAERLCDALSTLKGL